MILLADSEGPDQTARVCSLIWAFAVRILQEDTFSRGTTQVMFLSIHETKPGP